MFRKNKPTVQYVAVVNDETFRFSSESEMRSFLKQYRSNFNEIFSLNLYKIKLYNIKSL